MRVFRARGPVRSRQHDQKGPPAPESEARYRRAAPNHVRPAQCAGAAGVGAVAGALRQEGVRDRDSAQRTARRGAELRRSRCEARSRMQRLASLCRPGGGDRLASLCIKSEEHTSELQSPDQLACPLLLAKKTTKLIN